MTSEKHTLDWLITHIQDERSTLDGMKVLAELITYRPLGLLSLTVRQLSELLRMPESRVEAALKSLEDGVAEVSEGHYSLDSTWDVGK